VPISSFLNQLKPFRASSLLDEFTYGADYMGSCYAVCWCVCV